MRARVQHRGQGRRFLARAHLYRGGNGSPGRAAGSQILHRLLDCGESAARVVCPVPCDRASPLDDCVPCGQVLKRINAEIEDRRGAGEDLPPPPKTAIAGPEYFGFNQAEVRPFHAGGLECRQGQGGGAGGLDTQTRRACQCHACVDSAQIQDVIELLDPEHACIEYWQGKADREAHAAGLHVETSARLARPRPAAGAKKRRRRGRCGRHTPPFGGPSLLHPR